MELWHHTEDAPRSPEDVHAGQPVALWIGTWPIEMGQCVSIKWKVVHTGGIGETGEVDAAWQYNEPTNGNSYWIATIGPFEEGDEVEYRLKGESKEGRVSGLEFRFTVGPASP